jgi:hypothetical protein
MVMSTEDPRFAGIARLYGIDGLERLRAAMGIEQPEQTRLLAIRFDEIWATGEPGINATVLGL